MKYGPHTALLVVDVQNDFADPAGSLHVAGSEDVVPRLNAEIREATAAGCPVFHTQDWHPPHTPHFAPDGGIWPVHCVAGSWGADFPLGLLLGGPSVRKGMHGEDGYSGFTMRDPQTGEEVPTELDGLLREQEVERIVIGGLATDYCVRSTVLDARRLGYEVTVLTTAIAAVNLRPDDGARALEEMGAAGAVLR